MKVCTANKKAVLLLLAIFCFMYILNSITPMLNEDYFGAFVWPEGVPNLGKLPDDVRRVSSFSDVLENCRVYYLSEGGRLPGGFLVGALFWDLDKVYFDLCNSLLMTILVMEIYWLSHEGIVSFDFKPSYLVWIFFSLWAFNVSFIDSCLWISGSSNYLWMMVIVLLFLIPYTKNYYNPHLLNDDAPRMTAGMFFLGILAGWSHETTTCWLILVLFYWLNLCKKENTLQKWKIAGFIGLCIGYALLIFAPGNFARLAVQQQANQAVTFSKLYMYKATELVWIFLFHFFLWYFIVSFFCRYKNIIGQTRVIRPYLNMAKACIIIAFGSGVFMFLIPASIWRASFLNLIFLTIAAALLFRVQEIENKYLINKNKISFLKLIGYSYFIMTIVVSLWCNYINWNHWNDVLVLIQKEKLAPTNKVLYIRPYFTDEKLLWQLVSGSHLIYMPIVSSNENDRINVIVAKYYGIKGIAKEYSHKDSVNR